MELTEILDLAYYSITEFFITYSYENPGSAGGS
jgi:hypothetical protein